MIAGKSVLGIVPARGGSKGLPGKNLMPVDGRPLIQWTIDTARASAYIDRLVLSSDDPAIMATAARCGCDVPFRRPDALSSDTAAMIDVVLHALDAVPGFDVVVLLQPTSPLRAASDIDAACEVFAAAGASSCVSVCAVEQSPYWMYKLGDNGSLAPLLELPPGIVRRQDLPPVYALNGAVYVTEVAALRASRSFVSSDTIGYRMPPERSIDIDTLADFEAFKIAVTRSSRMPSSPTPPPPAPQ